MESARIATITPRDIEVGKFPCHAAFVVPQLEMEKAFVR
jgi:hypothetical protein